jgi:hypothetical protein
LSLTAEGLIAKIYALPAERLAEVEAFVDLLAGRGQSEIAIGDAAIMGEVRAARAAGRTG